MVNNKSHGLPSSKKLAQRAQFIGVRRLFFRQDSELHEKFYGYRDVKKVIYEGTLLRYPKTLWIIVLINTDFALSITILSRAQHLLIERFVYCLICVNDGRIDDWNATVVF